MINKGLAILLIIYVIFSCKQDETITEPKDWNYAGLTVHSYKIFQVDEINYDFLTLSYEIVTDTIVDSLGVVEYIEYVDYKSGVDTSLYYVKDTIIEKIEDLEGDSVYVIHRYHSINKDDWSAYPDSVWTAKLRNIQYTRTENNQTFVKLSFPISKERVWNINALNSYDEDDATYSSINQNYMLNGVEYPNVAIVELEDENDSSIVQDIIDYRFEYYAPNIGMIHRESIYLVNKQLNGTFVGGDLFIVSSGRIKNEKLIEHGL